MHQQRQRIVREFRTSIAAAAQDIFPLLCPVREYDWIPQWRCDMLYSAGGVAEEGCVFTTDFDDGYGREIWVVSHYLPPEKIAFVRTGPRRTTRYEIVLQGEDQATSLLWRQEITALDTEGDLLVGNPASQREFRVMMATLNAMLAHYLRTGSKLDAHVLPEEGGA